MITVEINESTPANMLRAIRAACNELLGETVELRLPTAAVESLQAFADQEKPAQEAVAQPEPAVNTSDEHQAHPHPAEELDSAGQPWNAELHASTKSKNGDGTWKKRRGSVQAPAEPAVPTPPAPPAPPAAPAAEDDPFVKIMALLTGQVATVTQAKEAAQRQGLKDLGDLRVNGTHEQKLAVLRELEGE